MDPFGGFVEPLVIGTLRHGTFCRTRVFVLIEPRQQAVPSRRIFGVSQTELGRLPRQNGFAVHGSTALQRIQPGIIPVTFGIHRIFGKVLIGSSQF